MTAPADAPASKIEPLAAFPPAVPVAVTMGEPAGIGGEIGLKAWLRRDDAVGVFFLIDSPDRLADLASRLGLDVPVAEIASAGQAAAAFAQALPVLNLELPVPAIPGELSAENAAAVLASIDRAVALVIAGKASAVVTNPIHKQNLYQSGFEHPGHTEYLAALAGAENKPVMMLASDELRVVPVTRHVSVRSAVEELSADLIVETAEVTARALIRDFGVAAPRVAVAGLNPHAGEGGAMGVEEIDIIAPAVERLAALGIDARGPLPADTLFHPAARKSYDVALCMYHDQALVPIKTIAFERAVNVTLGLPFIRTSPDHGTALDIAGQGVAHEGSLVAALKMAAGMARARRTAGDAAAA